ncbi:hypothetical protein CERZMDRAFT_97750 [Cercospora zeae-maydis SCOH1-5]|uniref:Uncharacterized protein n=1 Tax=Cercospora zeae-maydis SCOH1-5 TaxID=717836 RepID=A0A6A6FGQ4_9PEZI|nr:hypothetical protein CERZMDRAFT_97750 [Cercospora zeae-maydis SCOH1-5]
MTETRNGNAKSPRGPSTPPQQQTKPRLPPRQYQPIINARPRTPQGLNGHPVPDTSHLAPPPQRLSQLDVQSEPSATDYTRDVRRLTGYLIPFPKPHLPGIASEDIPQRFLVYTPPPRPFHTKPAEGKREGITQWTRRHWYKELREAKMRDPPNGKATTWKRLKWRGTMATDWGMRKVKSSNLEFLNRVAGLQDEADNLASDVYDRSVAPEEIRLIYPPSVKEIGGLDEETLKREFLASMQRTKRKAYKHSVYATLLMPPALVFDTVIVPIWPFGGAAEVDGVWLYASLRGAKTSRDVTKRLGGVEKNRTSKRKKWFSKKSKEKKGDETAVNGNHSSHQPQQQDQIGLPSTTEHESSPAPQSQQQQQQQNPPKMQSKKTHPHPLNLTFIPSSRIALLEQYLAAACHKSNPDLFPVYHSPPGETQVLEAIGWSHSDQDPAYTLDNNNSNNNTTNNNRHSHRQHRQQQRQQQKQNVASNVSMNDNSESSGGSGGDSDARNGGGAGEEHSTGRRLGSTSGGNGRPASRGMEKERRDAGGAGGLAQKAMNRDDEQWEILQVKDDLKDVFGKGAKEWGKWCLLWKKKPAKVEKRKQGKP